MKQTAVEWLVNELLYLDNEYDMKFIDKNEYQKLRKIIIEQAKEMEKEQMIELWNMAVECESFEQYYNETFKQ